MDRLPARASSIARTLLVLIVAAATPPLAFANLYDESRDPRAIPRKLVEGLPTLTADEIDAIGSIDELRRELDLTPDEPDLLGWRAWVYYMGGELDSAIADLWSVLHDDPEMEDARVLLGEIYLEKTDRLYEDEDDSPRVWQFNELAILELERVWNEAPEDPQAAELLSEAYNNKAYFLYLRDEQLPEALRLVDKAISLHAENTIYYGTKAEVLYALGRSEEALFHLRLALKDFPEEPELLRDLEMIQTSLSLKRD